MKPERWNQIDQLLDAALELAPGKRAQFLDHACVGDKELRPYCQVNRYKGDQLVGAAYCTDERRF